MIRIALVTAAIVIAIGTSSAVAGIMLSRAALVATWLRTTSRSNPSDRVMAASVTICNGMSKTTGPSG